MFVGLGHCVGGLGGGGHDGGVGGGLCCWLALVLRVPAIVDFVQHISCKLYIVCH